jgi:PAS domain S-box-containing protein
MSAIIMRPSTSSSRDGETIGSGPGRHDHRVQFYKDDTFLLNEWSRLIGAAVVAGTPVLVVATKAHRERLAHKLMERGLDLLPAIQHGRYLSLDATETLSQFMVDGWPDVAQFFRVVGAALERLSLASKDTSTRTVVFGEMVALLSAEGKTEAAIRLEQLWNELARTHAFQLHCAYPISCFPKQRDGQAIQRICAEHSHVIPSEDYTALSTDQKRFGSVIFLQQKAQALESEISERQKIQQVLLSREAELTDFLENAVVGIHWIAGDGTILWANKAETELLGYSREEYVGRHIGDFHADKHVIDDILERLGRMELLRGAKARMRRKDGSVCHVRIHSNVFVQDGKFNHTRCFTVDVTEQERSERRMVAHHTVTRLLAESATFAEVAESILPIICEAFESEMGAVWHVDEPVQRLQCVKTWRRSPSNFSQFEELTRALRFEKGTGLPGRIWAQNQPVWVSDLAVDNNFPRRALAVDEGLRSGFGFPITTKDGVFGVIEFFTPHLQAPDEEFISMMSAVGRQLGQFVEQKLAENSLRNSEERMRLAQQAANIGSFDWNLQTGVIEWTPELEALYGLQLGGFGGSLQAFEELVYPEDRPHIMRCVELTLETGVPGEGEWRVIWPDGEIHWLAGRWQLIRDGAGRPLRITGINIDVTAWKQAEAARNKLAAIVDSSDDAIVSKDLNGIITSWNDSAERIFGYTAQEIVGQPVTLLIPPELQDDEPRILAKIRAGQRIEHFETVRVRKNGERIDVSLTVSPVRDQSGNVIGVAKVARDITQQKKLEDALHTSERLASVGRLAATVAHEINNPLEAVTNFIYLAKQQPGLPEDVRLYLEHADRELGRVSHIAQQTLGFYRAKSQPAPLLVSSVIEDVLAVYESKFLYKGLRVERRVWPDLTIHASQGDLKQILSNLIVNAIDACRPGGRIVIGARASWSFQSGRKGVRITVADNGMGMSADDKQKLFTPFFTTKKHVGTGLGLWIAKDLLEKKEGTIRFRSRNQGKSGTVVTIFLPLQEAAPPAV